MIFHIGAIQRTERFPQWIGQFARVPQVLLSQVTRPPTHPQYEIKSNCVCFPLSSTLRLRAPSYFVNTETPEVIWQAAEKTPFSFIQGLMLHYRSKRRGFTTYTAGQLKAVATTYFKTEMGIEVKESEIKFDTVHVSFQVRIIFITEH